MSFTSVNLNVIGLKKNNLEWICLPLLVTLCITSTGYNQASRIQRSQRLIKVSVSRHLKTEETFLNVKCCLKATLSTTDYS